MNHGQITFKPYAMEQMSLLLLRLDELISAQHLVRVVNSVVDETEEVPLWINTGVFEPHYRAATVNNITLNTLKRSSVCHPRKGGRTKAKTTQSCLPNLVVIYSKGKVEQIFRPANLKIRIS